MNLDYFDIQHLRELPALPELPDFEDVNEDLPFEDGKNTSQINLDS